MALLKFTNKGIYCPQADVYIDPWRKVPKALITHAHSDHARSGHSSYLCTDQTLPILKVRLGKNLPVAGLPYGETTLINGVKFSFHPAGHIIGSAQVKAEYKGETWVVSGDYKIENDGISGAFEPVKCQHFITECTFGLPIYKWDKQEATFSQINEWWQANAKEKITSIITAYSLGKAQRLLHNVNASIGPIYTHKAISEINDAVRTIGINLKETNTLTKRLSSKEIESALIITPGSGTIDEVIKTAKRTSIASASGWMMTRNARKRRNVNIGFALSDHADWDGLNDAVKASGATHIYPTHGSTEVFSKWLTEQGYNSQVLKTNFEGEAPLV